MEDDGPRLGPDPTQWACQELFFELRDRASEDWFDEVIGPWLDGHANVLDELRQIGRPENHRARLVTRTDYVSVLGGLCGLSRILDVLISPFQSANDDPALLDWTNSGRPWWKGEIPPADTLGKVASRAGWTRITESEFHPFFHEIVAVEEAQNPTARPELISEEWPGFFVGSMLLVRAGVRVRAGRDTLDPVVATYSCLYWAWWRRYRKVRDLSHGWGHNSQWGTDFRRDYWIDGELHYNVNGGHMGHPVDHNLDPQSALELLRYRHSLHEDLGCDRWPYYDHHVETRTARR